MRGGRIAGRSRRASPVGIAADRDDELVYSKASISLACTIFGAVSDQLPSAKYSMTFGVRVSAMRCVDVRSASKAPPRQAAR